MTMMMMKPISPYARLLTPYYNYHNPTVNFWLMLPSSTGEIPLLTHLAANGNKSVLYGTQHPTLA